MEHEAGRRLATTLAAFEWGVRTFANLVRADPHTVRRWINGQERMPPEILSWADSTKLPPTSWTRQDGRS